MITRLNCRISRQMETLKHSDSVSIVLRKMQRYEGLILITRFFQKSLRQNTEGSELLNRVCRELSAFNTWVQVTQQRASNLDLSLQKYLSLESEVGTIEQGEEVISALTGAINQLLTECAWSREKVCLLSGACLLSTDLLSHLNVVWRSIRAEVQTARQKYQSDSKATEEFANRANSLNAWIKERADVLDGVQCEMGGFRNPSVVSFVEELQKREAFLPPLEAAHETLVHCLKRREKIASDTSNLVNQLNVSFQSPQFHMICSNIQNNREIYLAWNELKQDLKIS